VSEQQQADAQFMFWVANAGRLIIRLDGCYGHLAFEFLFE
jgi:hypothetical protein